MKIYNRSILATTLVVAFGLGVAGLVFAATTVSLGTSDNFAVLAGSGITDTTPSVVSGDVGLSPTTGTAIGIPTAEVTGTIYAVDAAGPIGSVNNPALLTLAQSDLTTAYNDAMGQVPTGMISADLGGQTLTPGVYKDNGAPASLSLNGTLTLDGGGDPDAVFIFQSGSTLTTGSASSVSLINGAQACNVFWQVGSSATLGTGSDFKGNILAFSSITDNGGSTVEGRLLAMNAAVTLNNTHVTKATCVVPPPPPAPIIPPPPAPPAASGGGNSSGSFAPLPLINLTKIPSPLALPDGSGSVTYTYIATNIGQVPLTGVWVKDDKCTPVYTSGDTNNDSVLDMNESWAYSCTKQVSETETNTATAHGSANGWDGYDTASATVVVGVSGVPGLPNTGMLPPLIHLVKVPNVFTLPVGGGAVTYRYIVTNPGMVPLSNVSVTDDKCTGLPGRVVGHPGDINQNNLLDPNEAWSFTCQTNIAQTTTNIGTAEGTANGLTAIDFSPATVVVATPGLPNTGFSPRDNNILWDIVISVGILGLVWSSLNVILKKRTI